MPNLIEGLHDEMNRVRELIKQYEALPNNAGFIGASFMKVDIKNAENAIASGDVIDMLNMYKRLKKNTG